VLSESEKLIVAAYWVFVVLAFSYNNYNLLFTMKYWSLSLKIESLIEYEQEISDRTVKVIGVIFWLLQGVMVVSSILILYYAYIIEEQFQTLARF
jgi:hypothetical protein